MKTATNARMTRTQIDDETERLIGLRPPPCGAPKEDFAAWWVAASILMYIDVNDNPHKGKIEGIEAAMKMWGDGEVRPRELLIPHIESALGRKLTAAEFESRTIFD